MRYTMAMAIAMLGVATPALADPWDFILTNNTGKEIALIEVSPAGAGQWQANKVEEGEKPKAIKASGRTTIHFEKGKECKWEIRATFADKSTATFPAVNVCDNAMFVVRYNNGTPAITGS
jgi:hypothetical protein